MIKRLIPVALASVLVACGGSSTNTDTSAPTPTVSSLDGLYLERNTGTTQTQRLNVVVFKGATVGLTGDLDADGGMTKADGVLAGEGFQVDNTFAANVRYHSSNPTTTGSFNSLYTSDKIFKSVLTLNHQSRAVISTAPTTGRYNFNMPANVVDVAGTWTLGDWFIAIDGNGYAQGQNAREGCSLGGVLAGDKSKNVFVSSLKVICPSRTAQLDGLAVTYLLPNGKRQLMMTGVEYKKPELVDAGIEINSGFAQAFAGVR